MNTQESNPTEKVIDVLAGIIADASVPTEQRKPIVRRISIQKRSQRKLVVAGKRAQA